MGFLSVFLEVNVCLCIICGLSHVLLFSTRYRWLILLYNALMSNCSPHHWSGILLLVWSWSSSCLWIPQRRQFHSQGPYVESVRSAGAAPRTGASCSSHPWLLRLCLPCHSRPAIHGGPCGTVTPPRGGPTALASLWWANQHADFSFQVARLLANQESQISEATPPLDIGLSELSCDFSHFSSSLHGGYSSHEAAPVPSAHRDPHPAKHVMFFAAVLLVVFMGPTGNFQVSSATLFQCCQSLFLLQVHIALRLWGSAHHSLVSGCEEVRSEGFKTLHSLVVCFGWVI